MRTTATSLTGIAASPDNIAICCDADGYVCFGGGLIWAADARCGLTTRQPRAIQVQANGTLGAFAAAVTGALIGGSTARAAVVADPADAGKKCWYLRADSSDADTAGTGNKRSELLPGSDGEAGSMAMDRSYTIGLKLRVADWRSTTDTQCVWQLHDNGAGAGLSPWLALYYQGGTRSIGLRYSLSASPAQGNTIASTVWSDSAWVPNVWDTWVIECVEAQSAGVARVWLNGVNVVDYSGPLGYREPAGRGSYWKQGVYHWTDSGNAWDASLSMRSTWHKGAYIASGDRQAEMHAMLAGL